MARLPRNIKPKAGGLFHIRGVVSGYASEFPLQKAENALELVAIIRRFTALYFCSVASLTILGNHYHLVVRFEAYRKLSREALWELACLFYPNPRYRPYLRWNDQQWQRFNERLFNVSELMRNVQSGYATWYNQRYNRTGRFWADRFRSTESDNLAETVFYVELNPVRAGLSRRPEQWRYSSAWMRRNRQDDWLMPIDEMIGGGSREECEKLFWTRLYWRGTRPSKPGDRQIPVELAEQMEREGFERGCYLKSIPEFTRGVTVGSRDLVERALSEYCALGIYRSEREPVPLGFGGLYAVRESRGTSQCA